MAKSTLTITDNRSGTEIEVALDERGAFEASQLKKLGVLSFDQPLLRTNRASQYPAPDGKLTFDKLSSVFASGNKTRDDQPNHIRIERRVPREVAQLWAHMCPAQVYETGREDADGTVIVDLAPSNCVQCGAITAKGGRLTPPEGGSGPEYTRT